jgi:hypothetical protein
MERDTENSKRLRKTNDMDLVNVNECNNIKNISNLSASSIGE